MHDSHRRRWFALASAMAFATLAHAQSAASAASGTLALANVPPAAREAVLAAIDARHSWNWGTAYELAEKALAADSTLGLARIERIDNNNGPNSDWVNAESRRAATDVLARPVNEATYLAARRVTGANAVRLFAAARAMLPGERRVALDQALVYPGLERVDSLRSLVQIGFRVIHSLLRLILGTRRPAGGRS